VRRRHWSLRSLCRSLQRVAPPPVVRSDQRANRGWLCKPKAKPTPPTMSKPAASTTHHVRRGPWAGDSGDSEVTKHHLRWGCASDAGAKRQPAPVRRRSAVPNRREAGHGRCRARLHRIRFAVHQWDEPDRAESRGRTRRSADACRSARLPGDPRSRSGRTRRTRRPRSGSSSGRTARATRCGGCRRRGCRDESCS